MQPPGGAPAAAPSGMGNYSDSAGPAKLYGALLDDRLQTMAAAQRDSKRKRRLNCVPVILALLGPWGLFMAVYGANISYTRYAAPMATTLGSFLALFMSLALLAKASKDTFAAPEEDRFYPRYLGASLSLAAAAGWLLGDLNFWTWMHPAYSAEHLATYTNVDPSTEKLWSGEVVPADGGRFQDAGKVYFSAYAEIDKSKSMSFKMGDLYCVAPIVDPHCEKNCGYDFWAVGVNCCSEDAADFHCGDVGNPLAKSGIRVMAQARRALFRLAVVQAEGAHEVVSRHPLFFYWLQDPVAEVRSWKHTGYKRFLIFMFVSFFASCMAMVVVLKSSRKSIAA